MKQIAGTVWRFGVALSTRMGDSNLGLIAAGVAFYAMFAVFPGMTATIAIWSLMADPAVIESYMKVAAEFIPPEAYSILNDQILALLSGPRATLGWTMAVSVAIALYSARAGVGALVQGLNVIHGIAQRSAFRSIVAGYVLTLALVGVMLLALATVVAVPLVLAFVPFQLLNGWLLSGLPWGAMFLLVLTALGILYRFGPNTKGRRDPWLTFGAVLAALAWAVASVGFSYYLANFGSYNRVYGSIGAVIALLMWLYLSAYSVLLGAALNAELAART